MHSRSMTRRIHSSHGSNGPLPGSHDPTTVPEPGGGALLLQALHQDPSNCAEKLRWPPATECFKIHCGRGNHSGRIRTKAQKNGGPVLPSDRHWVGTWAAAPAPAEGVVGFNNHTLRMNPRISLGGDRLRVRISNAYGNRPLTIGAAHIALRAAGPAIVADSGRKLS